MKDPYEVLGLSIKATQDEIKNAYRNFAKKFHPDLNPGNKSAEAKFKEAAAAYERIGTSEARAKFDRGETTEQQQEQARKYAESQSRAYAGSSGPFYHETQHEGGRYSSSFGKGMGGDEFFENLFRSAGQRSGGRASSDSHGEDHLYQMSVDFKASVLGAESEIVLSNGKKLVVKIPPGVETGSKLRFKQQGEPGVDKGLAGDAYIEITVRPLHGFKRVGRDIETEVSVSFIEALLGAEIKVPTVSGSVLLKIPTGANTGSRLRLSGKGVAIGPDRGDQIVVLKVLMPKKVDPELESIVRGWGEKYSYNPREEA